MMTSKFEANYSSNSSANHKIGFETRSSKRNGICWVRCLSLDNDSHNSGSFLSSPLSPAVPKFNDNKPGNLYNSNYLVYHHVILFFSSLVAAYLLFSWSFLYHNLPFGLLGLFYQDLPNCSSASVANSRSTTSSGKFKSTNKQQIQQSTKSAKNIFIYFLFMILCYTPLFFVYIISAINNLNSMVLRTFPVTVAFMNSSINPFLYCWRIPELRTAVFKTARLLSCGEMD